MRSPHCVEKSLVGLGTGRGNDMVTARPRGDVLEQVFLAVGDAILVIDARTRTIESSNHAIEHVFGYRVDEVIGRNTEFLHVDTESYLRFASELFPALDKAGTFHTRFKMRRKDGTVFVSEHAVTEIRDDTGERTRVVSVVRDVTEAQDREEQLRNAEQLLRVVLNAAPMSLFATDKRGIFTLHRGGVLAKLGMEQGENVGKSAFELFGGLRVVEDPDRITHGESVIRRVLAGETVRGETELGEIVFDNLFRPLRDEKGQPQGLVGVAFDITDRKRAERKLSRSHAQIREMATHLSRLEEEARRRLAADLHDTIGQTLSVVGINLVLIRHDLPPTLPPRVFERIDGAARQTEEIARRLRSVVAGLWPPTLDRSGLVAAMRWLAEQFADHSDLHVEVRGDALRSDPPSSVLIGLYRIAQEALTNMAKHASAEQATIAISEQQRGLTMTISDDGVGFDVSQKSLRPGRWGLTIMRERALGIGAEFVLESRPGSGTIIRVTWPADSDRSGTEE